VYNILEVEGLTKSFGLNKAVDNVSFAVQSGSFFSFLGQNGAGKSTTINILIGLLSNDIGHVLYNEKQSIEEFKNQIGVVFQNNVFDDKLTVKENLQLYGTFYFSTRAAMLKRYEEITALLGLDDIVPKRFSMLSGGQKRKAEIARALLFQPQILFLDEPTTGLDPKTRLEVWRFLHEIRKETGMTLFLTTHYMDETADADKVVIIHNGKKMCEGSPSELKTHYSYDRLSMLPKNELEFEKKLKVLNQSFEKIADLYFIRINDTAESIELLSALKNDLRFYEVKKGTMDDVFLSVVGESIIGDNTK
jgi:multidrug/hemolysin transport system ATP-binding protein